MNMSMVDVIAKGIEDTIAFRRYINHRGCPFCNLMPGLARQIGSKYFIACESDECHGEAQVTGKTVEEAWANWDKRA